MPILHWLTREQDARAAARTPYRLLEEAPALSAGDADSGNLLIEGDNLEALKALLPFYSGRVKCIYVDPPYNTRSAFEHYDDNLEHAQWLAMMLPRLELLRELLAEDGSIWVSIDDNEGALSQGPSWTKYSGEVEFCRRRCVWQQRIILARIECETLFFEDHDYLHVYACEGFEKFKFAPVINWMPRTDETVTRHVYRNPDNDPRGPVEDVGPFSEECPTAGHGTKYAITMISKRPMPGT